MPVPRGAEPVGSEGVKTGSSQMFTASRYRAAAAPSTLRFVQDASTVGGLARVPDLPSEALPLAAAWRQHGGAVTFDGRAGDGCNDPGLPFLKVETRGPCPEVAPRSGTCCSGTSSNGPSTVADTEDLMPGPVSHPELEGRAVACLPTEGCPTRAGCHEHGRPLHGDKVLQLRSRIRAMTEYCAPRGLEVGDSSPSHHASTATMPPSHLVHSVVPPLAKPAQHTASFQADIPSLPHATGIATADVTAAADATLCSVLGSSGAAAPLAGAPSTAVVGPLLPSLHVPEPQDKLASILSFLDEVEETSRVDISSLAGGADSAQPFQPTPGASDGGVAVVDGRSVRGLPPAINGLAQDVAAVQSKMSLLEVEVADKKHIIETLKQALADSREEHKRAVQERAREWDEKLMKQKAHYEESLERHLKLVDRLLNDKTELTKRCELFTEELKAVERKFQIKIEGLDEQASKELHRQKQSWSAAEKQRREAWEKEKVKEIKAMTIKGLQPEVERILADQKHERRKAEERHEEAMEAQRRELHESAQSQIRVVREQLIREHEQALASERTSHQFKLREEFERMNSQLMDERAKCASDLLAERRKHEQLQQQSLDHAEARLLEAVAAERRKAEASVDQVKAGVVASEEVHRSEVAGLKDRWRDERAQLQQECAERIAAELERKEADLREKLTKERDRQLEVVMERLSREHVERHQALKEEHAVLVEQMRADAAAANRRLTEQLEEARSQTSAAETRRVVLEQNVQHLQDMLDQEAARVEDMRTRSKAQEVERCNSRQEAEKAFEQQRIERARAIEVKDEELAQLRREVCRLGDSLADERRKLEEQKTEATQREMHIMSGLEARVKRTLQSKDDTIAELRSRCAGAENKVREFEFLLARQREELLSGMLSTAPSEKIT